MRPIQARALVLLATIGTAACGGTAMTAESAGSVGASSSGAGGASSSSAGGAISGSTGSTASASSSSGGGGGGGTCLAAMMAIGSQTANQGSCTGVVRLDYQSMAILGFQLVCGPLHAPTEAEARATAQMDTGNGQTGQSLAGTSPPDELVFFQGAADFGWGAAVSARTGRSVFGGTVVWAGTGDITYPKTWKPAAEIGINCGESLPMPKGRGFDLGSGMPLSASQVSAAFLAMFDTALPAGLYQHGSLLDVMVLLYPRSVGAFDPKTAEWIVLLNAG